MLLLDTTHTQQSKLAAFCRTGKWQNIPGVNKENAAYYRKLVYNIADDMLQNAYPLTHELLTAKEWNNAVNDFFSNHACQSPQVWYMPKEFYQFIKHTKHPLLNKYIFLEELLLFEWLEVELFMMEDEPVEYAETGDVLFSRLVLNPEHRLLTFQYPVHKINAKEITASHKGSYFVIAHRNREGEIIFTDSSPAFIRMIEYLREKPLSIKELITAFETEYSLQLNEENQEQIIHFFTNAYHQHLISGYKN